MRSWRRDPWDCGFGSSLFRFVLRNGLTESTAGFCGGAGFASSAKDQLLQEMIHFVLLISRQGKVRLTKWYSPYSAKEKARTVREVTGVVLARQPKQCNFLDYKDKKIIYKRYASLYFLACVDDDDNELIVLETIHHFVEVLDRYFGNVCELDLIFNFHKAYHVLDELLITGELQEPSKKAILRVTAAQDALMESSGDSKGSDSKHEL